MSSPAHASRPCPFCGDPAPLSSFDLSVADDSGVERHFFGLPAALCGICGRLTLDAEAGCLFGIAPADVVSAIESDSRLRRMRGLDAA
jgi:hypothetical protein